MEMQLRSWELRPPSANLRQRLFPAHARPAATFVAPLRWLAPALTCILLGALIINQESRLTPGGARPEPSVPAAWSNHNSSASLSNDIERAGSNLPVGSFELTNRSDSTSHVGAWMPVKLN
jgi:hypothetical protein